MKIFVTKLTVMEVFNHQVALNERKVTKVLSPNFSRKQKYCQFNFSGKTFGINHRISISDVILLITSPLLGVPKVVRVVSLKFSFSASKVSRKLKVTETSEEYETFYANTFSSREYFETFSLSTVKLIYFSYLNNSPY